jgi:hypothetical protein
VTGLACPGTAGVVSASPANKPSRRRRPRPWIDRPGASASEVRMPSPARMVMDRRSGPPRAIPTRGRPPGDRRATRMRRRGRVAGSQNRIRALGEGEINQLLAVTEVLGHMTVAGNGLGDRPDGPAGCWSDRTRGMAAMRGHRRSAAVLESASLPGPLVAVGPLHLGLSCLGWRPRGGRARAPTTDRLAAGLPASRSSPRPPPPGLPGEIGPNRAPAGRRSRCLVGLCSAPVTLPLAGGLGPGPL